MMDFLRTRALPWTVWLAAMAGAAFLWRDADVAPAQGFVDGARWSVAAPVAGTLASVVALPGQRVAAGDVLATLDDRELLAELDILAAEGRRIEAELAAVASDTAVRLGEATRGLEESVEAAERALQGARAERGVRAVELTAMTSQLDALKALVDKRMADRRDLDALAVKHAAVKKEVQSADARIAQLQSQVAAARSRRETLPSDAATRATDPLRAELSVVRQREELLRLRQEALTLRSPVAGEVTMVHLRAGEVAAAGASVASVAAAAGARVTVCMSEVSAAGVREGEAVELRRADGSTLRGRVERLGGEVAELPARCWQEARSPEWGKTATVVVEDEARLVPGEGFIVTFTGELSPRAGAKRADETEAGVSARDGVTDAGAVRREAATASGIGAASSSPTPRSSPTPLVVPGELRARSRFEPSGLVWVASLDRFVLVSDDTGIADGRDEHAPWLFTMDAEGRVDPAPLVIAGIDELRDLESIAAAPDGGLYVLCAQTASKKGKRPPARQRLVKVALAGGEARAEGMIEVASALDGAGRAILGELGITSTAGLDIEGMTASGGGRLLVGLKAPLSAEGRALIWEIGRPDRLLEAGEIAAGEVRRWGEVPLRVTADGAAVGGGIADLLALADGSLLIATTASGIDPVSQDGAVVHVSGPEGLGAPRRVGVFPGLKPEGLARVGERIVVVFDTGEATPLWMDLAWPPAP